MSYRTRIEDTQIFGNNDSYKEWIDFIKANGIEVDDDYDYEGDITDVQGMFDVIDTITRKLIKERHEEVEKGLIIDGQPAKELTDLSNSLWLADDVPILMFNSQMIENALCFLPYQVYYAVKDKIEKLNNHDYEKDGVSWYFGTYKIKNGEKIHVKAS